MSCFRKKVDFHLYWMSNDVSLEETGGGYTGMRNLGGALISCNMHS
jgi:hypothetical protein